MLRSVEQRGTAFLDPFIDQCSQLNIEESSQAQSELDALISGDAAPPVFTPEALDEPIGRLGDTACGPDRQRSH